MTSDEKNPSFKRPADQFLALDPTRSKISDSKKHPRSLQSVFPGRPGATFEVEDAKATTESENYSMVKLAGLSEEENAKLNYILSGGRTELK